MSDLETLESVYFAALECSRADRAAFLDEACRDNPGLRKRVERMLAAQPQVGNFLAPIPAVARGSGTPDVRAITVDVTLGAERVGTILDEKYTLVEKIGEGGMGNVYMARQTDPIKRAVAVKVIKAGIDSKGVLARFEAERQALAMMDHPNIARVLDAGTTDSKQPFFVMELVKGVPITQYCDERHLTPRQRLELFVPVCHAIQHAHQKGVIHRDIKPSNVLVAMYDDRPVPKVIDFGVAKATGQSLTDLTFMTGFGMLVGTPEYMSPEQANLNNLDVDTRSDVYSLGVLLYELLTGSTPVDRHSTEKAALLEVLRIVREVEAPKPSVKLSTCDTLPSVAAARGMQPTKLSSLMKGELDWVLLKALDKDRSRRYETANGFAADIQRYLSNEAVLARPPSAVYRIQKSWQRNKLVFSAGAAILASLVIGITVSTWQAVRADRESRRVAAALDELRATAPAFVEQARVLVTKSQFDEALEKLAYAAKLRPDIPEYLIARGDLLQCQLRLVEAAAAYESALTIRPDDARAKAGADLCQELLAAPAGKDGALTRESLSKLHLAMQRQQRPAAELILVARLLGEEQKLIVAYWLERLKALPVSSDRPLNQRLSMREDGLLALDLSNTKIADLEPLAGAPLAVLNVSGASELTSIAPLRGMRLTELDLAETKVADLAPLEKMQSLEKLLVRDTPVSDLTPLHGLRLRSLNIAGCPINDISPLRGGSLKEFRFSQTRVTDLSPLRGMPLKILDMAAVPVTDFQSLAGLPLEVCNFAACQLTDLSVLRGMPLRELLLWNCTAARNYAALGEIKTLELLKLPANYHVLPDHELAAIAALRGHPKLRQLGAEVTEGITHHTTHSKEVFWQEWDRVQPLISALRKSGFQYIISPASSGTYFVQVDYQSLSDLSFLKGMPISVLFLNGCKITDLTPIQDLPLRVLALGDTPLSDINPIRKMHLEELTIEHSNIHDVSPLAGLPLKKLYLHGCKQLTQVSALAETRTLEMLTVPVQVQDIETLRKLPNLKMLAFGQTSRNPYPPLTTASQFWDEFERLGVIRRLREASLTPNRMQRFADGTWELNIGQTKIVDLSILKGAPISELFLWQTEVSDLQPLRDLQVLKKLGLSDTKVTDLSPLKDTPLTYLNLANTKVKEISALRGMPLVVLKLDHCTEVTDVSPLAEARTLQELTLPPNAKNFEFLREFPQLLRIGFEADPFDGHRPDKTVAEFWREYDARQK